MTMSHLSKQNFKLLLKISLVGGFSAHVTGSCCNPQYTLCCMICISSPGYSLVWQTIGCKTNLQIWNHSNLGQQWSVYNSDLYHMMISTLIMMMTTTSKRVTGKIQSWWTGAWKVPQCCMYGSDLWWWGGWRITLVWNPLYKVFS